MVLQFLYGPICRADNDFGSGLILVYSNRFFSIIVSTYLVIVKLSIIHS